MDTAPFKGIIKNTSLTGTGGICYDKKYPGVTFQSDNLSDEEILKLSGPVRKYTIEELEKEKAAK